MSKAFRVVEESPLATLLGARRRVRMVLQIILIVLAIAWLFPLGTAFVSSIQYGGFANYWILLTQPVGGVWLPGTFVNSAVVALLHATIVLTVSALAGFAFSRVKFPGRDAIFVAVLVFLAVPATAILIPVYHITSQLKLFDSYLGVAMPEATLTLPFAVLLVKNFADGLPETMFEAAEVDGASSLRVFWSIYLPQIRTPLVNLGILCVMWSLQDFLFPSFILRDQQFTTAAQAVTTIQAAFGPTPIQTSQFYAALVLLSLPAILLIAFGLKWISRGLSSGGVKE